MDRDLRRRALAALEEQAAKISLSDAEIDSLKAVSVRMMQRVIPDGHRDRLAMEKLLEIKLGGLKITLLGEAFLRRHKRNRF